MYVPLFAVPCADLESSSLTHSFALLSFFAFSPRNSRYPQRCIDRIFPVITLVMPTQKRRLCAPNPFVPLVILYPFPPFVVNLSLALLIPHEQSATSIVYHGLIVLCRSLSCVREVSN